MAIRAGDQSRRVTVTATETPVLVEATGHVLTIRLDRPAARHALDWTTLQLLHDAFVRLEQDDELWVGVLTATGTAAFCAGADLATLPREAARRQAEGIAPPDTIMHGLAVTKPLVCALNGDAHGGGLELALACDLRVAADHVRLALPEARVGMIPAGGATYRLPPLIGAGHALRMMLTGLPVDAATALRWGLVDQVVPAGELVAATAELAGQLCRAAPLSTRAVKRLVAGARTATPQQAAREEAAAIAAIQRSRDAAEGVAAFLAKRPPEWQAR